MSNVAKWVGEGGVFCRTEAVISSRFGAEAELWLEKSQEPNYKSQMAAPTADPVLGDSAIRRGGGWKSRGSLGRRAKAKRALPHQHVAVCHPPYTFSARPTNKSVPSAAGGPMAGLRPNRTKMANIIVNWSRNLPKNEKNRQISVTESEADERLGAQPNSSSRYFEGATPPGFSRGGSPT